MSSLVKHYPVNAVFPGMVVAETVLSDNGEVMLEKGAVLTDTIIRLLGNWGIAKIAINTIIQTRLYCDVVRPFGGDCYPY